MSLRLGIDLDGVVADFNEGWTRLYNAEFGASVDPDEVAMWDAPVELTHFRSMAAFWRWAATCSNGSSLFRVLQPYPGAVDALSALATRHHIVILTTKPVYAASDTFAWIAEHRLPTTEVHIVDDKTSVPCDVYLDDGDHNLEALLAARSDAVVCRYVRPWNRAHPGAVDIDSWAVFRAFIRDVEVIGSATG